MHNTIGVTKTNGLNVGTIATNYTRGLETFSKKITKFELIDNID